MKKALLLLLLIGCDRAKPDANGAADAAPAPSASTAKAAVTVKANPVEEEIVALTKQWNDALARRDAEALRAVYGANVKLYQNAMSRDAAIKAKSGALAAAKDYTQSVRGVEIDTRSADRPKAVFEKKWTQNGKTNAVRASLVFAKEGGKWTVVEESDAPSDARRERATQKDSCEGMVQSLVLSVPEVSTFMSGPTNEKAGHTSNGFRLVDGPPDNAMWVVAIHENHEDRLVTMGYYDVDPKSGKVTRELDGAVVKPADATLVERVKAACK